LHIRQRYPDGMATTDPIPTEARHFSIRLPRPAWVGVATVVLVLVGGTVCSSADQKILDEEIPENLLVWKPRVKVADANIYQMVFGDDFDAVAARRKLDTLLAQKVRAVDLVCRLTDVQKQKLQLAGRGDNKRLIDRVEEIGGQLQLLNDESTDIDALIQEAELLSRGSRPAFPDDASLFVKTLAKALTPEQLARYEPLRAVYRAGGVVQTLHVESDDILVNLVGTPFGDGGLAHLSKLPGLHSLYLGSTQVTDAGLEHLNELTSLERLGLDDTHVTDAGLTHLLGLTNLRWLFLSNTEVTDGGVAELQSAILGLTIRTEPAFAKSLTITITSAANGKVGSMTVGLAKLFDGPLDGGRLRQLDRRLNDVFAIEGSFDQVLLRVGTNLDFAELMKIIDVCTRQQTADGKPVNQIRLLEFGDQAAAGDMSLELPVVGWARPVDAKGPVERLVLDVTAKGEAIVSGQRKELELYMAREAAMARKKLHLEGKKVKPGDELPTVIVVRADRKTPFDFLNQVLTECWKNGFRKFDLRVRTL